MRGAALPGWALVFLRVQPAESPPRSGPWAGVPSPLRNRATITSQQPSWRRLSVCCAETRLGAPGGFPQGGRDKSRPGRHECLRHVAIADNVQSFLGGPLVLPKVEFRRIGGADPLGGTLWVRRPPWPAPPDWAAPDSSGEKRDEGILAQRAPRPGGPPHIDGQVSRETGH